MTLKEWRVSMGYPQRKVGELMGKTKVAIHYMEKVGVNGYKNREILKTLSKNKISNFSGSQD